MRHRVHQIRTTCVLLVCLLLQAYVPVGYMPASGQPLRLALCSEGLYGQHRGNPSHDADHAQNPDGAQHCPFGCAPAAGPLATVVELAQAAPAYRAIEVAFDELRRGFRPGRAHQARGPPTSA